MSDRAGEAWIFLKIQARRRRISVTYEIITMPFNITTKSFHTDELNRFCLNKKILSSRVEFFQDEKTAYWTVFLEYETVLEHSDAKLKGLTEAGRLCYERLREWRGGKPLKKREYRPL